MAQRLGTVRVPSETVQGEGSFVVVRKIGYTQRTTASKMLAQACGGVVPTNKAAIEDKFSATSDFLMANDEFTQQLLVENVVAWNWVDDDGQALPLPREDVGTIRRLTDEEVTFLAQAIQGGLSKEAEKN